MNLLAGRASLEKPGLLEYGFDGFRRKFLSRMWDGDFSWFGWTFELVMTTVTAYVVPAIVLNDSYQVQGGDVFHAYLLPDCIITRI
ncbi:protein of unknown function [Kyrpidia spormannii]|uniref:Uncharacterized protein n=2 Tax=Kyrpidia spormannii TaxID=2055160 RepID=A0A6F9EGE9_9BACL|nr:protein of unknown function [Kyrpidia spormannii]CAB3395973.1 protein of unknown function [Kyrpidia spormannii]